MLLPMNRAAFVPEAIGRPMQDVKIFGLQHRNRNARIKRPWIVRWSVDGPQHSRAFHTRVEADRYRSYLAEQWPEWLERWSLRLSDLNRQVLAGVDVSLGLGENGALLAASTAGRFHKTAKACIRRAVASS